MIATILEGIQTIAAALALLSLVIMRRQMKKEYDCRRREQTVQLVGRWSENLHPNINRIKRVCEKLNDDQCRKIYNEEEKMLVKLYTAEDVINTLSTLGFKFSKIDYLAVNSPYRIVYVDCLKIIP